jgi:hypothetical protein
LRARAKEEKTTTQQQQKPLSTPTSFFHLKTHKNSYSLVAYRDEPAGLQKVVRDKVETVLEVIPNVSASLF